MDQNVQQAISQKTKKRVLCSAIIATLMIINTLIFSILAIYKFSTDDTSSEGHQLISQYYMFTEWDPHHGNSCNFKDNEMVCTYYYPKGAFMLPKKDGDHNDNKDDDNDQESGETTTKRAPKSKKPKPKVKFDKNRTFTVGPGFTRKPENEEKKDKDSHFTTNPNENQNKPTENSEDFERKTDKGDESSREPTNFDIYSILFPHFPRQKTNFHGKSKPIKTA